MTRRLIPALALAVMCAVLVPPVAAQSADVGADAFEAAYLFVTREFLRPVSSRDLLQGALAGLAEFLRARGLPVPSVVLNGQESHDLQVVRDAVAGVGRRLGTATGARDAGYAAVDGMLRELGDPFTRLVVPTSGRREVRPSGYSGIGVVLNLEVHPPVVTEVIDGTPAQRAGLRPGDILMEIDGRPTLTMPPEDVVARLRGLPGTSVVLRLRRGGGELTVTLVREIIGLRQAALRVIGGVGYLRLEGFEEGAGEEATAAAAELQRQGVRGLILDLRGNPGGYLDESVTVASIFLQRGVVTTLVARNAQRTRLAVAAGGFKFTGPVVVLVDGRTASAAEMVAGALQDAGAPVIGTKSYGKGTVQELRRLPGGAVLQLTVAQYLTPNGTLVDGRGILPVLDIEADQNTFGTDDDRVIQAALHWLERRASTLLRLAA